MSREVEYFLSANGRPFIDVDAARKKAAIVSEELGVPYEAVPHPHGGWCVSLAGPGTTRSANDTAYPAERVIGVNQPIGTQDARYQDDSGIAVAVSERRASKVINLRPAWRGFWKEYAVIFLGFAVLTQYNNLLAYLVLPAAILSPDLARLGGVSIMGGGFILILGPLLKVLYTVWANQFLIYHDHIETRHGIWARNTTTIGIDDIRSIDVRQGIIERLINVGVVELSTAGTATLDAESRIGGIASPVHYQKEIYARRKGRAGKE